MKPVRAVVWVAVLLAMLVPMLVTPTQSTTAQTDNRVFVNVDFLNLRTGPDADYLSIGILNGGEDYPVIAKSPDGIWFKVSGTPFGDGWVRGRFVIFRGDIDTVPVDSGPYGALTPDIFLVSINVPAFDFPRGEIVGTLVGGGTEYVVIGRSYDGLWVELSTTIGDVWVTASSGAFRGNWFSVPLTFGVPSAVTFGADPNIVFVNVDFLNLRTGPSPEFAILGILEGDDALSYTVEGISPDGVWFYITGTEFGAGWVRSTFTIFRGDIDSVSVIEPPYGDLQANSFLVVIFVPVFDAPRGNEQNFLLPPGEYAVTGRDFNGGWIRLDTPQFGEVWTQFSRGFFRGIYFNVPIIDVRVLETAPTNVVTVTPLPEDTTGFD